MRPPSDLAGVILAGGLSRRMGGGDKCLRDLGGRPLLAHVIDRISPQVRQLALNANGDPRRFAAFGLPVIADVVPDHAGPLAGILTGMEWARAHMPEVRWVLTASADAPFLPRDLAPRLLAAVEADGVPLACARSSGRTHPPIGLWAVDLAADLRRAMVEDDMRKIDAWTARHGISLVDWSDHPVDPFFNANRPEDLETALDLLAAAP